MSTKSKKLAKQLAEARARLKKYTGPGGKDKTPADMDELAELMANMTLVIELLLVKAGLSEDLAVLFGGMSIDQAHLYYNLRTQIEEKVTVSMKGGKSK